TQDPIMNNTFPGPLPDSNDDASPRASRRAQLAVIGDHNASEARGGHDHVVERKIKRGLHYVPSAVSPRIAVIRSGKNKALTPMGETTPPQFANLLMRTVSRTQSIGIFPQHGRRYGWHRVRVAPPKKRAFSKDTKVDLVSKAASWVDG